MSYQKNIDLKRFFKNFAITVVIVVFVDFLIGAAMKRYYFTQKTGELYEITYAIDSTRADFLVFGSSRPQFGYDPAVFENKLHNTFYDCGHHGTGLIFTTALISAVLDRYTPKHIIIDLLGDEFSRTEQGDLSLLLPYHDNPEINYYLRYNSKFEYCRLLSKMYPYNSSLMDLIKGHSEHYKQYMLTHYYKGFSKLYTVMPFEQKKTFKESPVNKNRVKILKDMLIRLSEKHVQVTLVVSPDYYKYHPDNPDVKAIEQLCRNTKNVKFYNYENNPDFESYKLFSKDQHLNYIGADKFSEDLANRLIADK